MSSDVWTVQVTTRTASSEKEGEVGRVCQWLLCVVASH